MNQPNLLFSRSDQDLCAQAEALWVKTDTESQKRSVQLFHTLYDAGHILRAGYWLGISYYQGRGVAQDFKKAHEFLTNPKLDQVRFGLYYRGLLLGDPNFSGHDEAGALRALRAARDMGVSLAKKPIVEIERRRLEYINSIVEQNRINEASSSSAFSLMYLEEKQKHPNISYASFLAEREANAVARNSAHATLGANIQERSRIQGEYTYKSYRNTLDVRPEHRVIEYGCGSLRVGAGFVHYLDANCFFGLDLVPTFYEIGCQRIGLDIVKAKGVRFHTIDGEGIQLASAFHADHVFASAVMFHIHPDDILAATQNLVRLASKPGAKLIFDCKVTRNSQPARYAQSDGKGGWAWPLQFYKSALDPLEFVASHHQQEYSWEPSVDFAHLEFRMPL